MAAKAERVSGALHGYSAAVGPALLLWLTAQACGVRGGQTPVPPQSIAADLCAAARSASCVDAVAGGLAASQALCVDAAPLSNCELAVAAWRGQAVRGSIAVNWEGLVACVESGGTFAECGDRHVTGKRQSGEFCVASNECAAGHYCGYDPNRRCDVCVPLKPAGGQCDYYGHYDACGPGLLCVKRQCSAIAPAGGSCDLSVTGRFCESDEVCHTVARDSSLRGECRPVEDVLLDCRMITGSTCVLLSGEVLRAHGTEGASCDYEDIGLPPLGQPFGSDRNSFIIRRRCQVGLRCDETTCVRGLGLGEACIDQPHRDPSCKPGLRCVEGACAPPGVAGEGCENQIGDCAPPFTCHQGTCLSPRAEGDPCGPDAVCVAGAACSDGVCGARADACAAVASSL